MPTAALAVFETQPQTAQNVAAMCELVAQAAAQGAGLVLFAETAITGFVFSGLNPQEDYPLAVSVDGPEITQLREAARESGVWVAFGFLERDGVTLFDSALLLNAQGQTQLHYQRISPGWRYPDAPDVYREGKSVGTAETPFGRVAFLLCGDAFDKEVTELAKAVKADVLLYPFARAFDEEPTGNEWQQEYLDCLKDVAPTILAVNALDADSVGGAFRIEQGQIKETHPTRQSGLLLVELNE